MSLFPGVNDKARACKRSRAERAKLGQIFTKIQEVSIHLFCLIQIQMTSALMKTTIWSEKGHPESCIIFQGFFQLGPHVATVVLLHVQIATGILLNWTFFWLPENLSTRSHEKNHLVLDHGCTEMMTWLPCWKFALMWMVQCDIHGSWYWLHLSLISGGMWSKGRAMWRRRRHILPFHRLSNPARFAKPSHLVVFHWLGCIITICSSFFAILPASRCTNNLCKICSQSFSCCTLSYRGANRPIVCILCARLTCNWKVESTFWVLNLRQQKNGRPRRKSRLRRQLKTSANEKLHLFHLR